MMKFENNKQKRDYMISKANERLGETNLNKLGSKMWIIRYGNANDIDVEFENGYVAKNKLYKHFKNGSMRSPYDISLYGNGYLGEGKFLISVNGEHTKEYICWSSMLGRCYSSKVQERQPTYRGCTVCEEWLNFQNFAKWHSENYYEIKDTTMQLDKDILHKGNKVYSPDTCIFVPSFINKVFTKSDSVRGNLPIGVRKKGNKYAAICNNGNKKEIYLGIYETVNEAFIAYKEYKEKLLKNIAEEYKTIIPKNLHNALINYSVEIGD